MCSAEAVVRFGDGGRAMLASPKTRDATKSVGIWIRVSTEEQAQGESPEHHERRARAYAEAKGWAVAEVYRLDAVSGKAVIGHPEAKRMLADVKAERISGLIFSKLARLARNTKELLEFADYFRAHGADLISLGESIDTSTPAGRLFYTMIAAMAEWEREEIAARVQASVPIRAKLGKRLGGQSPFGYVWKDGTFVPEPTEAPIRRLMYELFAEHKRKKTVARLLNERGLRSRKGAKWSHNTIDRLLRDPSAKGLRVANYSKSLGKGKPAGRKPKEDWVYHPCDPIVSEALWDECQAILVAQERGPRKPARKPVHLFAGRAFCGFCGDVMYVPSNSPKYVCRRCRNKIPIVDLEGVFHEQLRNFLISPEEISQHLADGNERLREKEELIGALEKERKKLSAEIDGVYALYRDGQIDKAGFGSRYRPLNERLKQIDDELPTLEAERDVMRIGFMSEEEVIAEARDLYARWPSLPSEEKRSIIESITEKIVVGQEDISISLLYTPAHLNAGNKGAHQQGFIAATSCTRDG